MSEEQPRCTVCGLPIAIGEWPCIATVRPHGRSVQTNPFVPYFDIGLGVEVTSLAQRWRLMKGETDRETGERRGQLDYRDKVSPGELSARRDRSEQQRKDAAR